MDLSGIPYSMSVMRTEDVPSVATIERQVFATPWSAEAFRQELLFHPDATYLVLRYDDAAALAERYPRRPWSGPQDPALIGYGGLWKVLDQGHISTLAIRPAWRGRGLGELVFASLIQSAVSQLCQELTLEVRVSNRTAQNLYAKYGLEVVGRRPRYYPDNHEDAWIMSAPSLQGAAYRTTFADLEQGLRERLLAEPHHIPDERSSAIREHS